MHKILLCCLLCLSFTVFANPPMRCEAQAALTGNQHSCVAMLYAFEADRVKIKHQADKNYTLVFQGLSKVYTYFSDRPNRIVGNNLIAKLPSYWSTGVDSFSKIPPNAVVQGFLGQQAIQNSFVFELIDPQYNEKKNTLTFQAILIGHQFIKHNNLILNNVSVFIDCFWNPEE